MLSTKRLNTPLMGMEKWALITGSTGGIGKCFACELASRGWNLVLIDQHAHLLEPLQTGMGRMYPVKIIHHAFDLTSFEARARFWSWLEEQGVRLDMLINVAGTEFEGCFADLKLEEVHTLLRLNIEAVVEMTHGALQRRASKKFFVINVASLAGFYPMPLKAVYAASKRFLINFSIALRQELQADGGNVLALCPAGLLTNPRSIRGIISQGLIGQLTTVDTGHAISRAVDLALGGRGVYIPGFINRVLRVMGGVLPATVTAAFVWRRWQRTRARLRT